ncbi:MAG: ATP-binding protein, partial [Pseudonocardiaceae bacterium]
FEDRGLQYLLGVNCFDAVHSHSIHYVPEALAIDSAIPIIPCDARERESTKNTLIALVEHAMRRSVVARA